MPSDSEPTCISVINMKGGVGKTTVAVSLAHVAEGVTLTGVLVAES